MWTILITLKKIHNYLLCQGCNSLREQGYAAVQQISTLELYRSIEYHKVFHKKLPLCQNRKIPIKSKENMKVKNIPMADLSCSSPLPSADQVEYMFHTSSPRSRLSATYQISLLIFCCLGVLYFHRLLLKSVLTLRFYNLVMRNKN